MVSKEAMDAAISIARKQAADEATKHVLRVQREIDEAREAVAPHVGKLKMSFDSAEAVYRKAFAMKGIDVASIKDAAALPVLLKNLPVPSSAQTAPRIAADSKASGTSLETLFPGLDRSHFLGSV